MATTEDITKEKEETKQQQLKTKIMKHLLLLVGLAIAATSCTADKFEQIDANFAELELRDTRLNGLIDGNTLEINDLTASLLKAKKELRSEFNDLADANDEKIKQLQKDTELATQLLGAENEALVNELTAANTLLIKAIQARQDAFAITLTDMNSALTEQNTNQEMFIADLLVLQAALVDAKVDTTQEIKNSIENLKVEFDIEFDIFEIFINKLIRSIPTKVRAEVEAALNEIEFANGNIIEINVNNGQGSDTADSSAATSTVTLTEGSATGSTTTELDAQIEALDAEIATLLADAAAVVAAPADLFDVLNEFIAENGLRSMKAPDTPGGTNRSGFWFKSSQVETNAKYGIQLYQNATSGKWFWVPFTLDADRVSTAVDGFRDGVNGFEAYSFEAAVALLNNL